eukprot:CAMPEP_0206019840 /NCGR_PEP_ID=MMETSP1464-20131121/29881_1 /ASSEMBLY_ACC=CAM_ASM_001124 /TAXON_ID=119497 /ORGANISM="Exanthemachrysis gayraliae, Strain RCC1523" /LENGTH=100 /DNA_ID=CAMNT_0053393749 /DNA_START=24 /DNA_END=326 /DNA_ORIENTATION=+
MSFRTVLLLLAAVAQALAFAPGSLPVSSIAKSRVVMDGKINTKGIEADSPKVVTNVELDKKTVFCRCWLSGTFPACDGSHAKHNEETGDNVGPLIVSPKK